MGEINIRQAFEICGYTSLDGYFTVTECNYIYVYYCIILDKTVTDKSNYSKILFSFLTVSLITTSRCHNELAEMCKK